MMTSTDPVVSVVIVSFNTRAVLRDCLVALTANLRDINSQIFVVDNASSDGSADMVETEFPQAYLIRSNTNLGFAAANNRAFRLTRGRYVILLNSDAFLAPDALRKAIECMDHAPEVALGGARLIGRDGSWQPSARSFPSPLNDFLTVSGLAARFPKSRLFGRVDRTWASELETADVDWVPGAFSIVRRDALKSVGYFDERFFLYYEEVDLCRRLKQAGHRVRYWPSVVVTHLGGESSKSIKTAAFSSHGAQLALWRMRSVFLYYRKHHGPAAWLAKQVERCWYVLRFLRNYPQQSRRARASESELLIKLLNQAWHETRGGRAAPAGPW